MLLLRNIHLTEESIKIISTSNASVYTHTHTHTHTHTQNVIKKCVSVHMITYLYHNDENIYSIHLTLSQLRLWAFCEVLGAG